MWKLKNKMLGRQKTGKSVLSCFPPVFLLFSSCFQSFFRIHIIKSTSCVILEFSRNNSNYSWNNNINNNNNNLTKTIITTTTITTITTYNNNYAQKSITTTLKKTTTTTKIYAKTIVYKTPLKNPNDNKKYKK